VASDGRYHALPALIGDWEGAARVPGHHGGHDGTAACGWCTEIAQADADHPAVTVWNISSQGEEARATEIAYARRR
jgi:hypothetical protein